MDDTGATYSVMVFDYPAQDTHVSPQPFTDIVAAKDYAAGLLRRIYADAPRLIAGEVDDVVERLIARVYTHRGPLTEYDPYLDCAVEIHKTPGPEHSDADRRAHQAAVADSLARVVEQNADILRELGTR